MHLSGIIRGEIVSVPITPVGMNLKDAQVCSRAEELAYDLWLKRGIIPVRMELFRGDVVAIRLFENVSELVEMVLEERVAAWIISVKQRKLVGKR